MKNKADETKHVPDVFELLEYAYNLGIERKEKTITTAELLDKFNEIISVNHFPFVEKVLEIGLGDEDNYMSWLPSAENSCASGSISLVLA